MWIASFDIGKKNFSFYIEEIQPIDHPNIVKKDRYNPNGTCKNEFSDLLRSVYCNGTKVLLKNVDITSDTDKKNILIVIYVII